MISLSNLVKQSYVVDVPASGPRVIDSNDLMEERLKEIARALQKEREPEPAESEFVEGIAAEAVTAEPEIKAEDIIADARAEAERILTDARNQADEIVNEADRKGQQVFSEQQEAGYRKGMADADREIEKTRATLEQELKTRIAENEENYQRRMDALETDIVDAVIQVFDHVFHIQFDDKREILLSLVNNTVSEIDAGKHFRIHVNQDDLVFLEKHLDDIQKIVGYDAVIELVREKDMNPGDCRIETDFGMYDCGLDTELNNLYKDIRSLCG